MATETPCAAPGCTRATYCRGLCTLHYQRQRRLGQTELPQPALAPIHPGLQFITGRWAGDLSVRPGMSKVAHAILTRLEPGPDGCWLWTGPTLRGYGRYGNGARAGVSNLAHRALYEALVATPDPVLTLDHRCRRRNCCNIEHLDQVTTRENTIVRGVTGAAARARQTHCKRGHEFTPENTWRAKNGTRFCRACNVIRQRATKQRRLAGLAAERTAAAAG